jgi:oxygen-independent coproporphyrinogen-3 oxidase
VLHRGGEEVELPVIGRVVHDGVPVHPAGTVTGADAAAARFGVYVHFPYCTKRCPYCDFAVHARRRIPHERYADAVVRELEDRAALFPDRVASTAYFGGGTPGLWEAAALGRVLEAVRRVYALGADAEVTVEVNPGEIDEAKLAALRELGVTRLSIGAQSFDDRGLRVLGRTHDGEAARAAVAMARRAGHDNVSLDLIFGLPEQGRHAIDRELDALLSLEVEHLSLYNLTVEPRTAFAALVKARALALPDSDRQAELYERVRDRLVGSGYVHHEISSFARAGRAAQHNTLYWTQGEYLGVGSSASSLRIVDDGGRPAGERFSNHRSVDRYLAAPSRRARTPATDPRTAEAERLEPDAFAREALWLSLRLVAGLDRAAYGRRFGRDPLHVSERWPTLLDEGLVEVSPTHIRLTRRGGLFADEVGARLV